MHCKAFRRGLGIVAIGSFTMAAPMAAETGLYLNADAGGTLVDDFTFQVPGAGDFVFSTKPGMRGSVSLGYNFFANETVLIGAGLESGVLYNTVDKVTTTSGGGSIDAELWQTPFLGNLQFTFRPDAKLSPFIGAGGGGLLPFFPAGSWGHR